MPLNPFTAFKNSPSSIRVLDVPRKIGLWSITSVQIQVTYPDSQIVSKECVRTGNVWVGTLEGTSSVGSVCKGYQITASGVDEDGNEVSGYVLGAGDVVIMELDGSIYPSESADYIRIFDEQPTNPKKGDAYFDENILKVYDGTQWKDVGGVDLKDYIHLGENNLDRNWKISFNVDGQYPTPMIHEGGFGFDDSYTDYADSTATIEDRNGEGSLFVGSDYGVLVVGGSTDYEHKGVFVSYEDGKPTKFVVDGHNILTNADVMLDETRKGYVALANHADYSDSASSSGLSEMANKDSAGNVITSTYATKIEVQNEINNAIGNVLTTEDF